MNTTMRQTLDALRFGEAQVFRNLTLVPILGAGDPPPAYRTLAAAMRAGTLEVTEKSQGGSVPELRVVNCGDLPVLLLDGEEVAGAKQNRVMNATVLLRPESDTIVNVSCTEHGRWNYSTPQFYYSGVVMARRARSAKVQSVKASLDVGAGFHADQGEVWDNVAELHRECASVSPTGAMRDAYEHRANDLARYRETFARIDGQTGFAFLIDGEVAGLELVSRADAYRDLHDKLVGSYVIDAAVRDGKGAGEPGHAVDAFLERVLKADESSFPSRDLGRDYRYESEAICGAALVHGDVCVHAALFASEGTDRDRTARSARLRRDAILRARHRRHNDTE